MKSLFIGSNKLVLNNSYSRKDVGYGNTQLAFMQINEHERIGFFNLGGEYDNRLTKKGFILNPRADLNNDRLIAELNNCTTYLFLREGKKGLYYFIGTSKKAKRCDDTHLLLDLKLAGISGDIVKKLGGFNQLP